MTTLPSFQTCSIVFSDNRKPHRIYRHSEHRSFATLIPLSSSTVNPCNSIIYWPSSITTWNFFTIHTWISPCRISICSTNRRENDLIVSKSYAIVLYSSTSDQKFHHQHVLDKAHLTFCNAPNMLAETQHCYSTNFRFQTDSVLLVHGSCQLTVKILTCDARRLRGRYEHTVRSFPLVLTSYAD